MNAGGRDRRLGGFEAVLFDLDGVLTPTAEVHAACWKRMFDGFLRERAVAGGEAFREFSIAEDYKVYVDGKPRYEGVRSFLESRQIDLPYGDPGDAPGSETICALGNRKSAMVLQTLATEGVRPYEGSLAIVQQLRGAGVKMAVVTSSKNCSEVLRAARMDGLFDAQVDGVVAADLDLPGKPAPDTFLEAARRLGVRPERAVVVEDAISGVQAGRAGGFGLVIGVDRGGSREALARNGADVVVSDLAEFLD